MLRFPSIGSTLASFGVAVLCLSAAPARAQVNVEPLRTQLAEQGLAGRVAASIASYAGNTQGVVIGASTLFGVRSARHIGYLSGSAAYARLDGEISIANWFAHLRHNYALSSRLAWEEFAQLESDRFRRVTLRELLGTGPRLRIIGSETVELHYGTAYMLEHTSISNGEVGEGGTFHRFSNYVSASLRLDPRIVISHVSYFQPRFDAPGDHRVLSLLNADLKVTRRIHSRLDAKLRYESRPAPDVKSADFELTSAIEVQFF